MGFLACGLRDGCWAVEWAKNVGYCFIRSSNSKGLLCQVDGVLGILIGATFLVFIADEFQSDGNIEVINERKDHISIDNENLLPFSFFCISLSVK